MDAVSEFPVREGHCIPATIRPKFPDQKHADWGGSTDCRLAYTRKDGYGQVHTREIAAAGTNVGAPVTAFDDDSQI